MSEYNRLLQEQQIEEELKWLDAERNYSVQRAIDSITRKPRETLPDKGKRDSNYLSKPGTPRQDT